MQASLHISIHRNQIVSFLEDFIKTLDLSLDSFNSMITISTKRKDVQREKERGRERAYVCVCVWGGGGGSVCVSEYLRMSMCVCVCYLQFGKAFKQKCYERWRKGDA